MLPIHFYEINSDTFDHVEFEKELPAAFNGMIIILNHILDDEEYANLKALLSNILKSIKIDLDKCYLINFSEKKISLSSILKSEAINKLLFFGIHPKEINFRVNLLPYQALSIDNRRLLFAASLNDLDQNRALKQKLWKSLKTL